MRWQECRHHSIEPERKREEREKGEERQGDKWQQRRTGSERERKTEKRE
jgi:hypothetical protein